MPEEPQFAADLYRGTSADYDRYRPGYPGALLADLRTRAGLDGSGSLLDLGCGTGQVTFALAGDVAEVTAVDQEPDAITFGAAKARRLGVSSIAWQTGRAETAALGNGHRLCTIANAFHRLERRVVAKRVATALADNGCLALLWSSVPWAGDADWQVELADALQEWRDRVADASTERFAHDPRSHHAILEDAGLTYEGRFSFEETRQWTTDTLLGFVRSTSFLNPSVLGAQAPAFEADIRQRLGDPPSGWTEETTSAYELARRRPT